jgi:hypothetical protein
MSDTEARYKLALQRIAGEHSPVTHAEKLAYHALSGVDENVCPKCRGQAPKEFEYLGDERWAPCPMCDGTGFLIIEAF